MFRKHQGFIVTLTMFITMLASNAHARLLLYPQTKVEYDPSIGSVFTGVSILVIYGFLLWFFCFRNRKDKKKSD